MQKISVFLSENAITLLVIATLVISVVTNYILSKSKNNDKIASKKTFTQLSKREYTSNAERSDKALVNTTISFGVSLCQNEKDVDDMYSKTTLVGNKLLRSKDNYTKISTAGKI